MCAPWREGALVGEGPLGEFGLDGEAAGALGPSHEVGKGAIGARLDRVVGLTGAEPPRGAIDHEGGRHGVFSVLDAKGDDLAVGEGGKGVGGVLRGGALGWGVHM